MDARRWGLAIAILALACAPPKERPDRQFVQQGRLYTAWLYGNEYSKLWERFSPEMQQTFGSVADLASFASRARFSSRCLRFSSDDTATAIISRPSSVVPMEYTFTRGLAFSRSRMYL